MSSPDDTPTFILAPEDAPADGILPIGYKLDSRYEVLDVRGGAGKSGMGIVYIVQDQDGHVSAVKTFQRRYARDLGFVQRFIREASLWMQAGFHPNIIHAYRVDIIKAIPYLFMEYVPTNAENCLSLADQLAFGPVPLPLALRYAVQFCDGMSHATRAVPGLVHRDIKPENLLIDPDGVLKITDFGLVRATAAPDASLQRLAERSDGRGSDPNLTGAGAVMGTPVYMSPEQFSGADHVTIASDIYAFGCCFYEMLTCFQPFRVKASSTIDRLLKLKAEHRNTPPPPLRARMAEAPPALEHLLLRCLEKTPEKRWPDFDALGNALRAIAAAEGIALPALPVHDATPAEVAAQVRSTTLLEGYGRAIQLRALRESQEKSPYAFHLVLASYFHYEGDRIERQEQLCKAFRARESELGYEAARQLVLLLLDAGKVSGAAQVMEAFIGDDPARRDYVREAWVRLCCAQGACDAAERFLDECEDSLETDALRLLIYRERGDTENMKALAEHMLQHALDELDRKVSRLTPESVVGWGRDGDADLLRAAVQQLRPELDLSVLDVADGVVWPNLDAYPDFAPDLAWLSESLGTLASLESDKDSTYRDLAAMLDYPQRMQTHQARDEQWFWNQPVPAQEH